MNLMEQSIFIGPELVKKFPAFLGTRRFITRFNSPPPASVQSQIKPVHVPHQTFEDIF